MKIAGSVVLYNPSEDVLDSINSYLPIVDLLYVIDNSTKEISFLQKIKNLKKIKYISLNGNKGIAQALKTAAETAIDDGFDFLLTMDQDSVYPTEDFKYVKEYLLGEEIKKVGVVGINYKNDGVVKGFKLTKDGSKNLVVNAKTVITSGSIINLENYKQIEGFKTELFIDFVDFDLCFQFLEKGFINKTFINIFLDHDLGKLKKINFLFFKKTFAIHSPIRNYYMYRNYHYLCKTNKNIEVKKILKEMKRNFGFISQMVRFIFANKHEHIKSLKMIKRGIKDGKAGLLGEFKE